jgi:hypothetical protein
MPLHLCLGFENTHGLLDMAAFSETGFTTYPNDPWVHDLSQSRFETALAAWVGRIRTRKCHFE